MQYSSHDSYKKPPRVRVWLELGGKDGNGAVEVGQPTTLGKVKFSTLLTKFILFSLLLFIVVSIAGVRAVLPGSIGVRIVDCSALDGLGESSQKLLDDRGCPIDEQVGLIDKILIDLIFGFSSSYGLFTSLYGIPTFNSVFRFQ